MSDDLVMRLREDADHIRNQPDYIGSPDYSADLALKAAARIERLEAALREISTGPDHNVDANIARAALKEVKSRPHQLVVSSDELTDEERGKLEALMGSEIAKLEQDT